MLTTKVPKEISFILMVILLLIVFSVPIIGFIKFKIMPSITSGRLIMKIQMLTQPKQIEITDNRVLLSVKSENWGLSGGDDWSHDTYNVYYDGVIEYENFYLISGKVESNRWQMDKESLLQLKNILENDFQKEKTHRYGCDGTGYSFTSFDENGITLHSTDMGYIYGSECLEGIMELLQKSSNE